jgi:hypothetical protein
MKGLKKIMIWCDEADRKGKFYSNFYGGILRTCNKINGNCEKFQWLGKKAEKELQQLQKLIFPKVEIGFLSLHLHKLSFGIIIALLN